MRFQSKHRGDRGVHSPSYLHGKPKSKTQTLSDHESSPSEFVHTCCRDLQEPKHFFEVSQNVRR